MPSVHWDRGRLALAMYRNLTNSQTLIDGYNGYGSFSDMEFITNTFAFEAFKLYPFIVHQFPNAVFILNTRDKERWVRSRLRHGSYLKRWMSILDTTSDADVVGFWRRDWDRHHYAVRSFFAGSDARFVEFNIENDESSIIEDAIPELAFDQRDYVHRGATRDKGKRSRDRPGGRLVSQ